MGTQQLLLLILSVIIVAVAIAGGIGIFQEQSKKANRDALIHDLNSMAGHCLAFLKMPASMGGGEGHWIPFDKPGHANRKEGGRLGTWLHFENYEESPRGDKFTTQNGVFWMNLASWEGDILTIVGSGNETGNDRSYKSIGHGNDGCVEVKMTISAASQAITLNILN
ncbi:MAG: hypothetical protein JW996_02800 [Candidatus Cloacimonetes bacterium]|nr:hypothetical protein [Candidatus Cloacimonadota bacterium]